MFQLDIENERRVAEDEKDQGTVKPAQKGRKTGPSFAGQRNPPWDPLAGQPSPGGDKVFDQISGAAQPDTGKNRDPLADGGKGVLTALKGGVDQGDDEVGEAEDEAEEKQGQETEEETE